MTQRQDRYSMLGRSLLYGVAALVVAVTADPSAATEPDEIRSAYRSLQEATLCANQNRSVRAEMIAFETARLGDLFRDQTEAALNEEWATAETELEASRFYASSRETGGPARIRFIAECSALANAINGRIRDGERARRAGAPDVRGIVGTRPGS